MEEDAINDPLGGSRCFLSGWMMQMSLLYLPLPSAWPVGDYCSLREHVSQIKTEKKDVNFGLDQAQYLADVWELLWVACQSSACCTAWITIICFGFMGRERSPNLPTNSITLLLFIAFGPVGRLLQCRSGGIGNGSVFLSPSFELYWIVMMDFYDHIWVRLNARRGRNPKGGSVSTCLYS